MPLEMTMMSCADDLIQPSITAATPLGSLSGWRLVLHCRQCGERTKDVTHLSDKRSCIVKSAAIYARPIGQVVAKFTCSGCGLRPSRLEAECVWAASVLPPRTRIDLSFLLPQEQAKEEPRQQLLFG